MTAAQIKTQLLPRIQYGALPFRGAGEAMEILLVTSRETRRWIVPKGWPIRGLSGAEAAAREAYEEAGVTGEIATEAVGSFTYEKVLSKNARRVMCDVALFPLLVTEELNDWPEAGQRERRWMPWQDAVARIREDNLRAVIIQFVLGTAKADI